jgi:transposase
MGRFIEGCDRRQQVFLPACVDDYVAEDNPVRVVDLFVDELDMAALGFVGAASTGRPGHAHRARRPGLLFGAGGARL